MALIDLKSDLSKFRSDFSTPALADKPYTAKLPTKNSRFDQGIVSIDNQLGAGSPFPDFVDSSGIKFYDWKPNKHTGFTEKNKYSIAAGKKGFLEATYTTNSPIDDVYKKYNLQEEAFNFQYIRHPLITRGIQRKGNEKPNRWGVDALVNFDDGLVRGGITTVVDRLANDTVRIAKWMASPKGLLWVVKQIGLGLTNANVEKSLGSTILGIQQTRVHTGLASLLSVPGTALGIHFTRHGIPFLNEVASYENVIKLNQITSIGGPYSRLISLRKQLGLDNSSGATLIQAGLPIPLLSGIGGSQSVYGVGITTIKRSVQSISNRLIDIEARDKINPFSRQFGYTKDRGFNSSITTPRDSYLRTSGDPRKSLSGQIDDLGKTTKTPGALKNTNNDQASLETSKAREKFYRDAPITGINSYITLAYNKIPKDADKKKFSDFRTNIETNGIDEKSAKGILGTGTNKDYYNDNNLEKKYGFGNLGALNTDPNVDRTTPTGPDSFLVKGLDFSRTKNRKALIETANFRGDKVNALDISSGTARLATEAVYPDGANDLVKFFFEDGDQGYNVMPFRCTITGLSDNFSPGWDRIDIMGRPDGAYLYSSFERSISFSFKVAALSRSEMIPMWRKLNYLASYTMPDFNAAGAKPSGPFMRITIGDMFQRTPGFIESLSYTIPDDATWDIADDAQDNKDAKQLPMVVEASVTFKIIADYRPQMMGRVYSLSPKGSKDKSLVGQWLSDAEVS